MTGEIFLYFLKTTKNLWCHLLHEVIYFNFNFDTVGMKTNLRCNYLLFINCILCSLLGHNIIETIVNFFFESWGKSETTMINIIIIQTFGRKIKPFSLRLQLHCCASAEKPKTEKQKSTTYITIITTRALQKSRIFCRGTLLCDLGTHDSAITVYRLNSFPWYWLVSNFP